MPSPPNMSQLVGAGVGKLPAATMHAPLALLPVAYPAATFLRAKAAATAFNLMIDRVSQDEAYLREVLAAAAQHDDFTVGAGGRLGVYGGFGG